MNVQMNYVSWIQTVMFLEGVDHGLRCHLTVDGIEDGDVFHGTVGEFLELIQRTCQHAERDGERTVYERLLAAGIEAPCPACGRTMNRSNPLSEDVVICMECRYE